MGQKEIKKIQETGFQTHACIIIQKVKYTVSSAPWKIPVNLLLVEARRSVSVGIYRRRRLIARIKSVFRGVSHWENVSTRVVENFKDIILFCIKTLVRFHYKNSYIFKEIQSDLCATYLISD